MLGSIKDVAILSHFSLKTSKKISVCYYLSNPKHSFIFELNKYLLILYSVEIHDNNEILLSTAFVNDLITCNYAFKSCKKTILEKIINVIALKIYIFIKETS